MILTGTIVNSAAIVAGSIAGLLLGKFIPERFSDAMEKGAALCVLYIGVDGMLAGENTLVAILSIAIGAILGELLQLDEHMHQLGDWVEQKFGGKGSKTSLSEGFVTASLLFCVGAMAIMGALDSGLTGDHSTLYAKALLDGIISVVYASTLGVGVALSAIPIFLYQGAIALGASFLAPYLTEAVILEMKCVGSILIHRPIAQYAGPHEDQGDELRPCGVPADPIVSVSVSKKKRSIELMERFFYSSKMSGRARTQQCFMSTWLSSKKPTPSSFKSST